MDYEPEDLTTEAFASNSNWRGPIWVPLNHLLIESLHYYCYGDTLLEQVQASDCPPMKLIDVAAAMEKRLLNLLLPDENCRRPFYGGNDTFDLDTYWKDLMQFHEQFSGDTGRGLGSSHQAGWSGEIAKIIQQLYVTNA